MSVEGNLDVGLQCSGRFLSTLNSEAGVTYKGETRKYTVTVLRNHLQQFQIGELDLCKVTWKELYKTDITVSMQVDWYSTYFLQADR